MRFPGFAAAALVCVSNPGVAADIAQATLPLFPLKTVSLHVTEGTGINLDVSPDGKLIALQLLGNIFTLPMEGGRARQLTQGPAYHENPQFSKDGRYIVYASDRDGAVRLWRTALDSNAAPALVPREELAQYRPVREIFDANLRTLWFENGPVFASPDSRYLVHHSRTSKSGHSTNIGEGCRNDPGLAHFVIIDRATDTARRLAPAGSDCSSPNMPRSAFTPDGRWFVTSFDGKLWRIAIPPDGHPTDDAQILQIPFTAEARLKIRPLTVFEHAFPETPEVHARRIEYPILSPDGQRLVFGAFHRLWIMDFPGGAPRLLTAGGAVESEPNWSPDGRHLIFTSQTDALNGDGHIHLLRVDENCRHSTAMDCQPRQLTRAAALYRKLTFSTDGAAVLAVRSPGAASAAGPVHRAEVISIPLAGGTQNVVDVFEQSANAAELDLSVARLQPRMGHPGEILRGVSRVLDPWPSVADAVVTLQTSPTDTVSPEPARTLLKIVFPSAIDQPQAYGGMDTLTIAPRLDSFPDHYLSNDVMLSPRADRALIRFGGQDLFLLDVPPRQSDRIARFTFDTRSPRLRRVTWRAAGADFPAWRADGRVFTFSFGKVFYVYDLEVAAAVGASYRPRAFPIDVTLPRELPKGTIALRNARLITMKDDGVIERGDLLVRDRRILAVGPAGAVEIPPDAHIVDLQGKTVIPGLIDLHNHVMETWNTSISYGRLKPFEANLAYGVLTSRDPQEQRRHSITYEDRVAAGELLGPRYMNTGPGINVYTLDAIDSMDTAQEVVARYADVYRSTYLKEYILQRRDARQWLVMAAAQRGLNVVSHGIDLKMLIVNAIDGYGGFDHPVQPSPLYDDVRQLLVLSGMTLSNQMSLGSVWPYFYGGSFGRTNLQKLRRYYPPDRYQSVLKRHDAERARPTSYRSSPIESTLNRLVAAGGRVGTGGHGDYPGLSTHLEMWAFVAGGMSPMDALRAGTLRGAQALGLERNLGSLEAGKLADLVVLDGNPLEDIRHTTGTRYILFNGRWRDATTLEELWPSPCRRRMARARQEQAIPDRRCSYPRACAAARQ